MDAKTIIAIVLWLDENRKDFDGAKKENSFWTYKVERFKYYESD